MSQWQNISLWMDQLGGSLHPRAALQADIHADVAIIGAGYTGLWTAYYLKRQAPQLRIVILEGEIAGFGASGRNGGWLMGNLLGQDHLLAGQPSAARQRAYTLLHGIPDEVASVLQREQITCDYRKGGVLYCAARYPEQLTRLRQQLAELRALGLDETDYRWLTPFDLGKQLQLANAYGAIYSPHCATIQPAKLVRGLASCVAAMGVEVYEQSRVIDWQTGLVRTAGGSVRADWIVPAVEGYGADLPPLDKQQLPLQSLLVATEPLPKEVWADIGLERGQAFSENSRQITYGQRSVDDRLVFGARGGYRFGGRLRRDFTLSEAERDLRRVLFSALFPPLKHVRITHAWGGNLAMARRFRPHMLVDRRHGIALSAGYGGEGVGASNLAGRTLTDLILDRQSELTAQPWVLGDQPLETLPRWEPEPLRWLGYNAIAQSFSHEDRVLANPHSAPWRRTMASALADAMQRLMR